jgi:hypothetical protein
VCYGSGGSHEQWIALRRREYFMEKAILFSEFPTKLVDKVCAKLRQRGVEVERVLPIETDEQKIKNAIIAAETIFIMREMGSHPKINKIRSIAANYNKECQFLSRKASGWQLQPVARDDFAVPSEQLEDFLREYVKLSENGISKQEMVQHLSRFWREGVKLSRAQQLGVAIYQILRGNRCPPWFKEWTGASNNSQLQSEQLPQPEELTVSDEHVEENANNTEADSAAVASNSIEDIEFLAAEYARERDELRARVAKLDEQVKILNKELERLRVSKNEELSELVETARAVHRLVKKHLNTPQEGYVKLLALCGIKE